MNEEEAISGKDVNNETPSLMMGTEQQNIIMNQSAIIENSDSLTYTRLKAGNVISAIFAGSKVGEMVVDENLDPSTASVTDAAWHDFGFTENMQPSFTTEDDEEQVFRVGRGYIKDKSTEIVADSLKFTLLRNSQLVNDLIYRPDTKLIDGASIKPFTRRDPSIKVWLKVEKYNGKSEKPIMTLMLWGKIRLDGDPPEENNKSAKYKMIFECLYSDHDVGKPDEGFGFSAS